MSDEQVKMINLTIDGVRVSVPEGTTIMQAAETIGIYIPRLCYHPNLSLMGSCRVCIVDVKEMGYYMTSCSVHVWEGMEVETNSPEIRLARRDIVELLLDNHSMDCQTCERDSNRELQNLAYSMGVRERLFEGKRKCFEIEDHGSAVVRNSNKCILCGRCVRACEEQAQYHAIDFQGRGIKTSIQPPVGSPIEDSDCVFCGQCVQVCPVGALSEKTSLGMGRPWDIEKVKTVCSYCGVGCEVEINVNRKTGKIANVTTNYSSPTALNKGRSCVKGRFAWQFVNSEDRLTTPLIREGDTFRKASWDEALSLVAEKLGGIKEKHGGDALGFFSSARCTNEENYLMQRLAREVMGTNNVDHCAHL